MLTANFQVYSSMLYNEIVRYCDWSPFVSVPLPTPDLQEVKEIEKVMDRDFYMTAQEAMDFGVVDKIITKRPKEGEGSGIVE